MARKDEFRAAKPGEKAEVVVQIESGRAGGERQHDHEGRTRRRGRVAPLEPSYGGPSQPQTEKLARNLRALAEQMKASPPAK